MTQALAGTGRLETRLYGAQNFLGYVRGRGRKQDAISDNDVVTLSLREGLNLDGFDRVFIGQPVRYGDRSFIRIALGASDVRRFVQQGPDFENDRQLIRLIESAIEEMPCE